MLCSWRLAVAQTGDRAGRHPHGGSGGATWWLPPTWRRACWKDSRIQIVKSSPREAAEVQMESWQLARLHNPGWPQAPALVAFCAWRH